MREPDVASVMTTPVRTIQVHEPLGAAARLLAAANVRRLFVVNRFGLLVGVVSRHDVIGTFQHGEAELT